MIHTIPLWASFTTFLLLQAIVLAVTGLPIWQAKRRGEAPDPETMRAFRITNMTTLAIFLVLFDALGVLRLLNIDPMLALVQAIVTLTDIMRGSY